MIGDQVALGNELLVRLHDHPTREAELLAEGSRRRHGGAGGQATRAHGGSKLLLELPMERLRTITIEWDEELEL